MFGIIPAGDDEHLVQVVRAAVRAGFAVVVDAPAGKAPICTLTAKQAKTADRQEQERARAAGEWGWERRRHPCGLNHALTETPVADRVMRRLIAERGTVNIGVEVGRSRMLVVDVDTAAQRAAFLADWAAESGQDESGRTPTVSSPGKVLVDEHGEQRWVHKDGGHYWFSLPDDVDLDTFGGSGTMAAASGWVAMWKDHQVLVPPSTRAEGPYRLTGPVERAPAWLVERITAYTHGHHERRTRQKDKIRHDGDPIDAWSAATAWADLLGPDGWVATGLPDNCSCPIWTRPGSPASPKSATAHELGCTRYDSSTGHAPLHVWTDDPPEYLADAIRTTGSKTLSKLQYVAWRDHCGDARAAMDALDLAAIHEEDDWDPFGDLDDAPAAPQPATFTSEPACEMPPQDRDKFVATTVEETPAVEKVPPPEGWAEFKAALAGVHPSLRMDLQRRWLAGEVDRTYRALDAAKGLGDLREKVTGALDRASETTDDEEAERWRIDGLWAQDQIVLLSAKWKAGKTTMVTNVVRSLVDGEPFLGQFEVSPVVGNVLIVNAEMTRRQFNQWLRDAPIKRRDKVYVLHVREAGPLSGDILEPSRRDILVDTLNDCGASVLIMDPLNPLLSSAGVDENANTEVANWFAALGDVVERTGVTETMLVHHFGHSGERGRGASKFMDAPDALWVYTKDEEATAVDADDVLAEIEPTAAPRYLSAVGRDVELVKSRVLFDPDTRTLTMPVIGGLQRDRVAAQTALKARRHVELVERIVADVTSHPGVNVRALRDDIGGRRELFTAALEEALRNQLREEPGARGARHMYLSSSTVPTVPHRAHAPNGHGDVTVPPRHPVGGPGARSQDPGHGQSESEEGAQS